MKLPMATVLLTLVLGANVARADYTFLAMPNINTTVNDTTTLSSFGTVSGFSVYGSGSGLSLVLNLTSADTLFSVNDVYASLVHINSQNPGSSPASVFLNGTGGFPVVGAGTYTPTLSLGIAAGWLVNGTLNGDWGLYVDTTRSGANFTVNSWSLEATPEPSQVAAMALLLGFGGLVFVGRCFLKKA